MGWAAAGSLIATGVTTGMSFYQSSQQRNKQREAEAAAKIAMDEAKKKLDVNFYKGLGIPKEPYELEREAMLSTMSSTIQAGVESDRGIASVAGAVNMANNVGQRNIAGAMGQDLMGLNKLIEGENINLNQQKIDLDARTARGAQLAARNNEQMANRSFMQGMEGVTSLVGQVAKLPPLYGNDNSEATQMAVAEKEYNTALQNKTLDPNYLKAITVTDAATGNDKQISFAEAFKNSGFSSAKEYLEFLRNNQNPNLGN